MSGVPLEQALIASADELTPEWLTGALRGTGALSADASIVAITRDPIGTGQMADTVRLGLRADPPGSAPSSIVGKFASGNEQSRATGLALRAYEIEVNFYAEVAPRVACRLPAHLYQEVDPTTGIFTLLLEDIDGARQGDQIAACGVTEAGAALGELAGLHGPCWESPDLAAREWLNRNTPESAAMLGLLVGGLFPGFLERYETSLAPDHVALCRRFVEHLTDWQLAAQGPRTVTHGDFRLDNMLFRGSDPSPYVVDWQTTVWGLAAYDVAYFVGGCLGEDDRRANEPALLEGYFAALSDHGVRDYPFERFLHDYRRGTFAGVLMGIAASMLVERTERGDQMFMTSITRHAQHALDLDAEAIAYGSTI